jgi:hypothetical protein
MQPRGRRSTSLLVCVRRPSRTTNYGARVETAGGSRWQPHVIREGVDFLASQEIESHEPEGLEREFNDCLPGRRRCLPRGHPVHATSLARALCSGSERRRYAVGRVRSSIFPSCVRTSNDGCGEVAGPLRMLPSRRKVLPWQGQVTASSLSLPLWREQPRWEQRSARA